MKINRRNIIKILLITIVVLGFFLRFAKLAEIPPALGWDEAALGYNAYSLGIDGRDEFGKFLPYTALESFGDFKPPVYSYLDIIPIKIFGLNEFSVRFPSAFFGSLAVLLTFFLAIQLFPQKNEKEKRKIEYFALLSALFLAISPWHIMLSRGAFEANIASFLILAGGLFFLLGINKKKYNFIISAVFFAISFYAFNSARIVVPILLFGFGIFFYKELLKSKKEVLLSIIIGLIMLLPLVPFLLSPEAALRFKEVNIFSDPAIVQKSNSEIAQHGSTPVSKLIYNRRWGYLEAYSKHYFDHFNPKFLFITGDGNPRFSTQKVGQLFIWDLPFILFGIYILFKKRDGYWFLIPFWLVVGIIPAGIARETPHALRIESALPMYQLLVAYGFVYFLDLFNDKKRKIIFSFFIILLALNLIYFINVLNNYYPVKYASEWQYGYKDAVIFAKLNKNKYEKVFFTDKIGRPYVYYLFFNKIDPLYFRNKSEIKRDVFGFINVDRIDDNIYFERELRPYFNTESENLYIDYLFPDDKISKRIPSDAIIIRSFPLPDGSGGFVAYTKK